MNHTGAETCEDALQASCTCSSHDSLCTSCVDQDGFDMALLMLDAVPQGYSFISFSSVAPEVSDEDAVATCSSACIQDHAAAGCIGFTITPNTAGGGGGGDLGSSGWTCVFVSSYDTEPRPSFGARLFVVPRCLQCSQGFALEDGACRGVCVSE